MSVGKATNRIAATQCSGHEEIMATQAQFNSEPQTSGLGNNYKNKGNKTTNKKKPLKFF